MASAAWAHIAIFFVQLLYAGYHVSAQYALDGGVDAMAFCALRDLIAAVVLIVAVFFLIDRKFWVPRGEVVAFSVLLGLLGIFLNQVFFLNGLKRAGASRAATWQLSVPFMTFIISLLSGSETIHWRRCSGLKKILGMALCAVGTVVTIFYEGPKVFEMFCSDGHMLGAVSGKPSPEPGGWLGAALLELGIEASPGDVYLGLNCMCVSVYHALQKYVMNKYPATAKPSLTAWTYVFGALFVVTLTVLGGVGLSDFLLSKWEWMTVAYAGVFASAFNYCMMSYTNDKLGPTMMSFYMPFQPIFASILSCTFLRSSIYLGSITGGILLVAALWALSSGQHDTQTELLQASMRREPSYITDPLVQVVYQKKVPRSSAPHAWSLSREDYCIQKVTS